METLNQVVRGIGRKERRKEGRKKGRQTGAKGLGKMGDTGGGKKKIIILSDIACMLCIYNEIIG